MTQTAIRRHEKPVMRGLPQELNRGESLMLLVLLCEEMAFEAKRALRHRGTHVHTVARSAQLSTPPRVPVRFSLCCVRLRHRSAQFLELRQPLPDHPDSRTTRRRYSEFPCAPV